ncbi:UDP-N-acetylmuramoyl-tripeptide--D-alanyl-D-alanine ligase, partial [Myxococcota bacterium]|nr:UDP-N-acetylmuramoyl-tripeptide--D-alanyl-D-alanine ligase [Myxococcota bacterium]
KISALGESLEFRLGLPGEHNAMNACAAIAVAAALGRDLKKAVASLAEVSLPGNRLRIWENVVEGVMVLDDSYNANPASMSAAFSTLRSLAGDARRIVVLGDMFELGKNAATLHHDVGVDAAKSGADLILALGGHAKDIVSGARDAGALSEAFDSIEPLITKLRAELCSGDWLLLKGSRGMRMERVREALQEGKA